jgi:hypothetical protein
MGNSLFNNDLPSVSILCTGLLMLLAIVFLPLETLVEMGSSLLIIGIAGLLLLLVQIELKSSLWSLAFSALAIPTIDREYCGKPLKNR